MIREILPESYSDHWVQFFLSVFLYESDPNFMKSLACSIFLYLGSVYQLNMSNVSLASLGITDNYLGKFVLSHL